jgi:hypothetical protein
MSDEAKAAQQPTPLLFTRVTDSNAGAELLLRNPGMTMEQWVGAFGTPEQIAATAQQRGFASPQALTDALYSDYIASQHAANARLAKAIQNGAGNMNEVLQDKDAQKAGEEMGQLAHQELFKASAGWRKTLFEVLESEVGKNAATGVVGGGLAAIVGGMLGGKKMILPAALIGSAALILSRYVFKDAQGVPYLDKALSWLQNKITGGSFAEVSQQLKATGDQNAAQLAQQWDQQVQKMNPHQASPHTQKPQQPTPPTLLSRQMQGPQPSLFQQYGQPYVVPPQPSQEPLQPAAAKIPQYRRPEGGANDFTYEGQSPEQLAEPSELYKRRFPGRSQAGAPPPAAPTTPAPTPEPPAKVGEGLYSAAPTPEQRREAEINAELRREGVEVPVPEGDATAREQLYTAPATPEDLANQQRGVITQGLQQPGAVAQGESAPFSLLAPSDKEQRIKLLQTEKARLQSGKGVPQTSAAKPPPAAPTTAPAPAPARRGRLADQYAGAPRNRTPNIFEQRAEGEATYQLARQMLQKGNLSPEQQKTLQGVIQNYERTRGPVRPGWTPKDPAAAPQPPPAQPFSAEALKKQFQSQVPAAAPRSSPTPAPSTVITPTQGRLGNVGNLGETLVDKGVREAQKAGKSPKLTQENFLGGDLSQQLLDSLNKK